MVPIQPEAQPSNRDRPVLSVVMPVYNEVNVLEKVVGSVTALVLDVVSPSELVLVDDRGDDGSGPLMRRLAEDDVRIRIVSNACNVGHGPSLRHGLDASRGEWVLLLDSDDQVEVSDFATMWALRGDADLVYGVRHDRQDPLYRRGVSAAANALITMLVGRRVRDANAGFKLVRRELYEQLRPGIPDDAFAPSIMLVMGGIRAGATVAPVEVAHRARSTGHSTLHAGRLARALALSAVQIIAYRLRPRTAPDPGSKG